MWGTGWVYATRHLACFLMFSSFVIRPSLGALHTCVHFHCVVFSALPRAVVLPSFPSKRGKDLARWSLTAKERGKHKIEIVCGGAVAQLA